MRPSIPSSKVSPSETVHEASGPNSFLSSGSPSGTGDDEGLFKCTFYPNGRPRFIPCQNDILVPVSLVPHLQFWQSKVQSVTRGTSSIQTSLSQSGNPDACNTGWGGRLGQLKVQGLFQVHQKGLPYQLQRDVGGSVFPSGYVGSGQGLFCVNQD